MSSRPRAGARERDYQHRIGTGRFHRVPPLLTCFVDVMLQNIMKRAEHLILHHRDLVSLLQKIFGLFGVNLIRLLSLHNDREIPGCLV